MGSTYKRGNIWWISYYRDGFQMRESSDSASQAEAKRLLSLREADIAKGIPVTPRIGRLTFSELAEDLIMDYKVNERRSLRDLEARLNLHILPAFGNRRASAITTADINAFKEQRREAGASNAEINRELAAVKRAFSLAIEGGKMLNKPHIPMLKENNVRKGFFELEQFEAVRKNLSDDLRSMVSFAYITGWRIPSEVLKLRWAQVDFNAGIVRLEPGTTKNDEARVFPFPAELRQILETRRAKTELLRKRGIICQWVFHRAGIAIREYRRSWKTACKTAGTPGRIPHDFRRTAVRNLVRAGVPERVAMQMTGHKTRSVFERYNIVSEGDLFDAARRLDERSQAQFQAQSGASDLPAQNARSLSA
jgi:integrase